MNTLSFEKQVHAISALVEGNSIRGTERLCGVNRETVMNLGVSVGEGCRWLHHYLMTNLQVNVLELDEIWGFIGKKERRLRPGDSPDFGDQYTFIALDRTRKTIVSFLTGKRTAETTDAFAMDLRSRIVNRPQISSDGFQPYIDAIARAFCGEADYAQIIKTYGLAEGEEHRYSPPKCTGAMRNPISGDPAWDMISTSFIERQNLTVRMSLRRFTRLTNAFSKKLRNHAAAVALYVCHYNFCRVHETLKRITPAMAIGVADHVWSVAELIEAARSMAPGPEEVPPLPPCPALPEHGPGRAPLRLLMGGKAGGAP